MGSKTDRANWEGSVGDIQLQVKWNYDASVAKMKPLVRQYIDITNEMKPGIKEAYHYLKNVKNKRTGVHLKTWSDWLEETGIGRMMAWRFLEREGEHIRKIRCIGSVTVTDEVNHIWPVDCIEGMKSLRDELVDVCVTSPPYWKQRDYQVVGQSGDENSVQEYIDKLCVIFDQVYRILNGQGVLWLNLGDAMREKQLLGIPWRTALALQLRGWRLRSEVIWHKPAPMPDGARDRPTRAHEQFFMFSKSDRYNWDEQIMSNPTKNGDGKPREFRRGNPAHTKRGDDGRPYQPREMANIRDVWTIGVEASKTGHAAAFPSKLIDRPIRACCRIGGVVLDPFMGTGTTAVVAKRNGRHYIGFEINPQYCRIAERRLSETGRGLQLDG